MAPRGFPAVPAPGPEGRRALTIDCDHCLVRGHACGDCVVSCLLGGPPEGVTLTSDEMAAINALSSSGLVPPLRLVTPVEGPDVASA